MEKAVARISLSWYTVQLDTWNLRLLHRLWYVGLIFFDISNKDVQATWQLFFVRFSVRKRHEKSEARKRLESSGAWLKVN